MADPILTHSIKDGLIRPDALKEFLAKGAKNIILLDASFTLPGQTPLPHEGFISAHIPGAQFFDIKSCADQENPLPHMLCDQEQFQSTLRALNIGTDHTVIIYGQKGILMGPARAWWTFRAFGFDTVCVLDGGLPAWQAAGGAVESGPPKLTMPQLSTFAALSDQRDRLLISRNDVLRALNTKETIILDARPQDRYEGQTPEPRKGLQSGHIPGSHNIPCNSLVDSNGFLKSKEELHTIFAPVLSDKPQKIFTSCGSGVTACVIALALFRLGYKDIPVYDGSWAEWGQESLGLPIAKVE